MPSFSEVAFKELIEAKRRFGEYQYHDKGAYEVMDLDALIEQLKRLPIEQAINELKKLSKMDDTHLLISGILISVDDDPHFERFFEVPELLELY